MCRMLIGMCCNVQDVDGYMYIYMCCNVQDVDGYICVVIRHGVKYIEMYLNTNTNTFEGFKYKYF